jgi:hypothetical protein
MPYVIAKTIFLYVFHKKYNQLDPCFFSSEIKQQIKHLRKNANNCSTSELDIVI